jgi:hypothetical protein
MRPRPQRNRRPSLATWALRSVAALVVFGAGVALGQALDDSSPPAGTRTSVRTLVPGTLNAGTVTVTVETAAP